MTAFDIFLSYKREGREQIETIKAALEDLNLSTWHDRHLRPGHHYPSELEQRLQASRIVLVSWSREAASSPWVLHEANYALRTGKLVTARIEDGLVPPGLFTEIHASDLSSWDGCFDNREWLNLVEELARRLENDKILQRSRALGIGQNGELVDRLEGLLCRQASKGRVSYEDTMEMLVSSASTDGIKLPDAFSQPSLWQALDEVAQRNRERREPPLTALVVSSKTGLPGRGYFQKHCFLEINSHPELCQKVHDAQLARVVSFDWGAH